MRSPPHAFCSITRSSSRSFSGGATLAAMRLRLATPDDVAAIRALIPLSVRGLNAGLYSPAQLAASLQHVFGVDTQLVRDGTYFVLEENGELAAAGGWSRRRTLYGGDQLKKEDDPLLDPASEPARIRAFFVHPAHARRGLGRMLLDACVREAARAGFRALELGATLPGVAFYEAHGFVRLERIEESLPGGVLFPVVRMRRELGGS
jgi:GNAT superfamily N-acetyltransferase